MIETLHFEKSALYRDKQMTIESLVHKLKKLFTEHPYSVKETYFEHFCFAFKFASDLFLAAFACFIHAIFPFLFKDTASDKVCQIVQKLKRCGRWRQVDDKEN